MRDCRIQMRVITDAAQFSIDSNAEQLDETARDLAKITANGETDQSIANGLDHDDDNVCLTVYLN